MFRIYLGVQMIYILIYLIITFSTFLLLDHVQIPELDNKDLILISVFWPFSLLLFVYGFLKGFYDMFKK
jgi:hypothetical protein